MPAEQVLDIVDDEVRLVNVRAGISGLGGETTLGAADRHAVCRLVVRCAGGDHVQGHGWVLHRLRGETPQTQKHRGCRGRGHHGSRK